jgi:hypothetical protein
MSDPQHLGLGELGQRVQAMSDPAPNPRLRPYQAPPIPIGPASNGRPAPSYEPFEEFRVTPVAHQPQPVAPSQTSYSSPRLQAPASFPNQVPAQPPIHSGPASRWENVAVPDHAMAEEQGNEPASAPPVNTQSSSLTAATPPDPNAPPSGLQRAINAVRSTLPLVQKLLPLLDGNFATALGALVAPHTHPHPAPPPQPVQVDLEPMERGLAEVRNSHRELRGQVLEQVTSIKRVEDQLERVREATDRNTLEQQELVEDLRTVGSRISTFAIIGLALLAISLGLNIYLLVQLQHILR